MSRTVSVHVDSTTHGFANGYLFGIPLGNLGWFGTVLIALASGFFTFFATTFCAIFGILFYNIATHGSVDYALSYRWVGLPAGLLMLGFSSAYLGRLWIRRMLHRG
jgi:hypothetical protein